MDYYSAAVILVIGSLIYAMSFLPRSSLSTPLISVHGKKVIGGTLIILGLALFAFFLLKAN